MTTKAPVSRGLGRRLVDPVIFPPAGTLAKVRSTGELVRVVRVEGAPGAAFAVIVSAEPQPRSRFAQRVVALADLAPADTWAINA
jgi:hypothetical protein